EGGMNRGERFLIIASAVKIGHAHATEADGGDARTTSAQLTLLHGSNLQKASEAPNPKHQNPKKLQNPMFKGSTHTALIFGVWILDIPWSLELGAWTFR